MSIPEYDDLQTAAALYAVDLLDPAQRQSFEALMKSDEDARRMTARFEAVAAALAQGVPARNPPPELRERLLARIQDEPQKSPPVAEVLLAPGLTLVSSERLDWQETGIPGVRVKPLHVDPVRNYASNLVYMEAGSVYPRHWHADLEELFMLSGQITLSGHRLRSGDYCRAEPGSIHEEVVAESDSTFIALASLRNEFRPDPASAP